MTDALCHLVVDGNEVLEFKLVRSPEDIENSNSTFKPDMCHQVFGENENIFGYTNLRIKLYYSAGSLQNYLGIEYTDKIEPTKSDGMKADDVEAALKKVLAPEYVTNLDHFISMLDKDKSFTPHGQLVHAFTYTPRKGLDASLIGETRVDKLFWNFGQRIVKNYKNLSYEMDFRKEIPESIQYDIDDGGEKSTFEIYYNETSTPDFLAFHQRLQTFLLWYVDAASFIDVDDDQWTFFTVFEKYSTSDGEMRYATAAYATVYRYYAYPRHIRPRISQVLTLPPFRKRGICAQLIQAIYSHYTILPEVIDITVEDPSEDFQRVRDYVDAKNCESLPAFQPENLVQGFSSEMANEAKIRFKINKKQSRRVYEILRLKCTNLSDKTAYQNYRLDIKNRLNAPFQKKKLEMAKFKKALKPEEFAAAVTVTGANETHDRLSSQYLALEQEYRRVIHRMEQNY